MRYGDQIEDRMQANRNQTNRSRDPEEKVRRRSVLLVGQGGAFNVEAVRRIFNQDAVKVVGRTRGLPGALRRLEAGAIDVVLLGCECREDELQLFAFDAQRRGFAGPILRLVSTDSSPTGKDSPDRSSEHRSRARSVGPAAVPSRAMPGTRDGSPFDVARGSTPLTPKERTVLMRMVDGWTSKQIGQSLQCTESSIKAAIQQIFRKFGVRSRSLVVRLALEGNLTEVYKDQQPATQDAQPVTRLYPLTNHDKRPEPIASRPTPQYRKPIRVGDFVIDVSMHRVWVRGVETHLSPREFDLLTVFAMHPNKLLRSATLREMFWRNPTAKQDSLRVLVRALRRRVETTTTPRYIVTQHSFGYRFIPFPSASP